MRRCVLEAKNEYRIRQSGKQSGAGCGRSDITRSSLENTRKQHDAQHYQHDRGPLGKSGSFELECERHEIDEYRCAVHECHRNRDTAFRDAYEIECEVASYTHTGDRRPEPQPATRQSTAMGAQREPNENEKQPDRAPIERHHNRVPTLGGENATDPARQTPA